MSICYSLKRAHSRGETAGSYLTHSSLDPHESALPPNSISIGSAVFAQLNCVPDTQTRGPRYVRHL